VITRVISSIGCAPELELWGNSSFWIRGLSARLFVANLKINLGKFRRAELFLNNELTKLNKI